MTEARHVDMMARAMAMATLAHEGQTRHGGRPFFHHPVRVSVIVSEHGGSPEAVIAAILHDAPEDSDLTFEKIARETNAQVAHLVNGVTDSELVSQMPRRDRKAVQAAKYAREEPEVQLIKLADQTDNLESMKEAIKAGKLSWVRGYAEDAILVAKACRAASPDLYLRAVRAYEDTLKRVELAEGASLGA